jgi:hypothetical protein
MNQIETAIEKLAQIEKNFFKGTELAKASKLEGEERRDYVLTLVDVFLSVKAGSSLMSMWLSDQFFKAGKGRKPMHANDPLLSPEGQQTLSDSEKSRLQLILEVAGLCHDLSLHFTFDLHTAFGISKNDWWVSNKQLVEWLSKTKYEMIAMHTAYILKKHANYVFADMCYLPAQDALFGLFSIGFEEVTSDPKEIDSPRLYTLFMLNDLRPIEKHWQRGRRRKLNPEVVILHDEILGRVPRRFNKGVLAAAQELYNYMNKMVCGRLALEEYDENADSLDNQPETVKKTWGEVLENFADKVREVRFKYLAEGMVRDNSLAFTYLMAHAQRCGQNGWHARKKAL